MVAPDIPAALHQTLQQIAARSLGQMVGDGLVRNVVRRLRFGGRRKRRPASRPVNQDIAVTGGRMKLQPPGTAAFGEEAAHLLLKRLDPGAAGGIVDMTRS